MSASDANQKSDRPVAIVTGASRGIGRAIAIQLARAGYDLMINYASNEAAAEEACSEVHQAGNNENIRVARCRADVAEASDREHLLSATREEFGRLDLLVNNAGVAPQARVDLLEANEES
ncbi:MAG TPA: SDR family NAD(P)-dependent oxidoreductase, partial [Blastocatellia bacterium]|nr:SDR family NAD(P)-dependent oxidoreductase [Blastocatellia bacterium]